MCRGQTPENLGLIRRRCRRGLKILRPDMALSRGLKLEGLLGFGHTRRGVPCCVVLRCIVDRCLGFLGRSWPGCQWRACSSCNHQLQTAAKSPDPSSPSWKGVKLQIVFLTKDQPMPANLIRILLLRAGIHPNPGPIP